MIIPALVLSIFMTGLTLFNNSLVPLSNKYSEILLRDGLGKSVSMEKGTDIFLRVMDLLQIQKQMNLQSEIHLETKYFLLEGGK